MPAAVYADPPVVVNRPGAVAISSTVRRMGTAPVAVIKRATTTVSTGLRPGPTKWLSTVGAQTTSRQAAAAVACTCVRVRDHAWRPQRRRVCVRVGRGGGGGSGAIPEDCT